MPSKQEQLDKVENIHNDSFDKRSVLGFINAISFNHIFPPSSVRKGDVYYKKQDHIVKKRPYVVIKVLKDYVYSLPLSTTYTDMCMNEVRSRFFNTSYFTNNLCQDSIDEVLGSYVCTLDDTKQVNEAIRRLKIIINNL